MSKDNSELFQQVIDAFEKTDAHPFDLLEDQKSEVNFLIRSFLTNKPFTEFFQKKSAEEQKAILDQLFKDDKNRLLACFQHYIGRRTGNLFHKIFNAFHKEVTEDCIGRFIESDHFKNACIDKFKSHGKSPVSILPENIDPTLIELATKKANDCFSEFISDKANLAAYFVRISEEFDDPTQSELFTDDLREPYGEFLRNDPELLIDCIYECFALSDENPSQEELHQKDFLLEILGDDTVHENLITISIFNDLDITQNADFLNKFTGNDDELKAEIIKLQELAKKLSAYAKNLESDRNDGKVKQEAIDKAKAIQTFFTDTLAKTTSISDLKAAIDSKLQGDVATDPLTKHRPKKYTIGKKEYSRSPRWFETFRGVRDPNNEGQRTHSTTHNYLLQLQEQVDKINDMVKPEHISDSALSSGV